MVGRLGGGGGGGSRYLGPWGHGGGWRVEKKIEISGSGLPKVLPYSRFLPKCAEESPHKLRHRGGWREGSVRG